MPEIKNHSSYTTADGRSIKLSLIAPQRVENNKGLGVNTQELDDASTSVEETKSSSMVNVSGSDFLKEDLVLTRTHYIEARADASSVLKGLWYRINNKLPTYIRNNLAVGTVDENLTRARNDYHRIRNLYVAREAVDTVNKNSAHAWNDKKELARYFSYAAARSIFYEEEKLYKEEFERWNGSFIGRVRGLVYRSSDWRGTIGLSAGTILVLAIDTNPTLVPQLNLIQLVSVTVGVEGMIHKLQDAISYNFGSKANVEEADGKSVPMSVQQHKLSALMVDSVQKNRSEQQRPLHKLHTAYNNESWREMMALFESADDIPNSFKAKEMLLRRLELDQLDATTDAAIKQERRSRIGRWMGAGLSLPIIYQTPYLISLLK